MTRPYIIELRVSPAVEEKLGKRHIWPEDVVEILFGNGKFFRDTEEGRTQMIGSVEGRMLTIVVEPTETDGIWEAVTGWPSSKGEATKWKQAK